MQRKQYLVWFVKKGKPFSIRGINAASEPAARAEAERRVREGGVVGIREACRGGIDDYVFGKPGITVWSVVEYGEANEQNDRDLVIERCKREGLPEPVTVDPDIPF